MLNLIETAIREKLLQSDPAFNTTSENDDGYSNAGGRQRHLLVRINKDCKPMEIILDD
jgi:hypothetical protein